MVIHNPFRYRATEQLSHLSTFHGTFGIEMLSLLPQGEELWNRLIVFRSAPGAGKTSLLKLFSAESLVQMLAYVHPDVAVHALRNELVSLGVIGKRGVARLGILISLRPDYKALIDLGPEGPGSSKILFKLLDARIMRTALEAVAFAKQVRFPVDLARIEVQIPEGDLSASTALDRLARAEDVEPSTGVISASRLLEKIERIEREVLGLLDSLVPVEWDRIDGHSKLYSLDLLGSCEFLVDGESVPLRPLLLIDDVDELHHSQRVAVYEALLDRNVNIGRWVAERQSAVGAGELIGKTVGRDVIVVAVDDGRAVSDAKRHRMLRHVADTRGAEGLRSIDVHSSFTDLLGGDTSIDARVVETALQGVRGASDRVIELHPAYASWFQTIADTAASQNALEEAIALREALIRFEREQARSSNALFGLDFDETTELDLSTESQSKDRVAARLFLSREHQLPYYYGADVLSALSSRNVEQFLRVAGDAFDAMVAAATRRSGRPSVSLSAAEQDRLIRRSSVAFWSQVPNRVERGRDVLALLTVIASVAVEQTYRLNAPYAPGVTGTALPYLQRNALLDVRGFPSDSTERLSKAIQIAVAENLLEMSPEISRVKGQDLITFHLNRLLLPALRLPLQRSGFREQTVATLAKRFDAVIRLDLNSSRAISLTPGQIPGWPR